MKARPSDPFVGRARELAELERALDAARSGTGATVLVAGDAGIGKTRLASELASRAGDAGFEVLLGRSIDLVGTELPYQPLVDALRPLGDPRQGGSQLRGVRDHAGAAHRSRPARCCSCSRTCTGPTPRRSTSSSTWRTTSATGRCWCSRPSAPTSRRRPSACAVSPRVSGARGPRSCSSWDRSSGRSSRGCWRLAPAAPRPGRRPTPSSPARRATPSSPSSSWPRPAPAAASSRAACAISSCSGSLASTARPRMCCAWPQPSDVTSGIPCCGGPRDCPSSSCANRSARRSSTASSSPSRIPAASASAMRSWPRRSTRPSCPASVRSSTPGSPTSSPAAERRPRRSWRPHWAAAGRAPEALVASVAAARQAQAVFGLAEAAAHLERALTLWDAVPAADQLLQLDLAGLCSWAAELASQTGAAPRALELARRVIDLVEQGDPLRAARLYDRLGRYLHESGRTDAALSAFQRVVELVPAEPPSPERAQALASLATGLMLAWRFDESLAVCEQALALARAVGAPAAELQALLDLGRDLAYVGRADEGVARLRQALTLAEERGDPQALLQAHSSLTDVLTMLGRPEESARVGERGLDAVRRYGIDSTVLVANRIEALLAIGEWDQADGASAVALRAITANFPYMLLMLRADLELGRGDFAAARPHLDAALATLREDRGQGIYDVFLAELALWERRWTEADRAVRDSLARSRSRQAAQLRVWFAAKGLRAHAELAALARARRDTDAARAWLAGARRLIAVARRAAAEAAAVTPNTGGWLAVAEAEYARARGVARPESWREAAAAWDRLERPPLAAYCRWREAEALVAAGASRAEASAPLRAAHAVAARSGANPLLRELELLAQRARLDLAPPAGRVARSTAGSGTDARTDPREAEVLALVARGYTNREIAAALVISVKTASVHVSHILRKLDAPNRLEAATIAHRLGPREER